MLQRIAAALAATSARLHERIYRRHSELATEDDDDLLAWVTGLGERAEPGLEAQAEADRLDDDWPDLSGSVT